MEKIDGKKIAEDLISILKKEETPKKFLAVFSVSPDEATKNFLNQKKKIADELGIDFRVYEFEKEISQDELRKEIFKVASGNTCGGAIVQLPLPKTISPQYVLNVIPREKDVDVLGERALGAFYSGRNPVFPPSVGVFEEVIRNFPLRGILDEIGTKFSSEGGSASRLRRGFGGQAGGKIHNSNIAVVGLGNLVGKPIADHLMGRCKNLYLLDKGSDFSLLKNADVVICGAGDPWIITPEMLKDNSLIIDFGYGEKDGKVSGDFKPKELETSNPKLINYTPTPGGTGPILVAKLFENFYTLTNSQKPPKKKPLFYKG